jgi:hypothetical protein
VTFAAVVVDEADDDEGLGAVTVVTVPPFVEAILICYLILFFLGYTIMRSTTNYTSIS